MKRLLHAALGYALLAAVLLFFQGTAQGAPGDFLYKWGANSTVRVPYAIARDQSGNVYVSEIEGEQSIVVYNSAGKFLRQWGSYGSGDGQLSYPAGIAVASNGDVFVTEANNNRVQVFDSAGKYLRKWGTPGSGDGEFSSPQGIAISPGGNIYVADSGNDRIQVFDSAGHFLGKWGTSGTAEGQFDSPIGIAIDPAGKVYVAEWYNARVQLFDGTGKFERIFARVNAFAIAIDVSNGHVVVTDSGGYSSSINICDGAGNIIRNIWSLGDGSDIVDATGVAIQSNGNIYVVDQYNSRIDIFDSAGTFLNKWFYFGAGNGEFNQPTQIGLDSGGNVYVNDTGNDRVEVFTSTGGFLRKWDLVDDSRYRAPFGLGIDGADNIYASDLYEAMVTVYDPFGKVLRQWGGGGPFGGLGNLAVSMDGTVYGESSSTVQVYSSTGTYLASFYPGQYDFKSVNYIAVDAKGNMYLADGASQEIAVLDSQGNRLRTIGAGKFTSGPGALAVDGNGNVFAAGNNDKILAFDSTGVLRGTWGGIGGGDGLFSGIHSIAVDKSGTKIFVSDNGNNRIQVLEGFGSQVPSGWSTRDVGSVGVAGRAGYAGGIFTLAGSGADIWGTADGFRYVYQPLTGDGQILARVASLQNTNGYAKGGVMIRESLAANSRHAMMVLTPTYGAEFSRRTATGGSTTVAGSTGSAPYWVKLVRQGNTFTGYVSSNGTNWTLVASSSITMASSVYIGLVVSSHNNASLCTATVDNVSLLGATSSPTVAITTPAAGASFTAGSSIPITASATPGSGAAVKQVVFYSGTTVIGTATAPPYQVSWSNVAAGDYTLTAQVQDTLGAAVTSAPVKVTVTQSTLPSPWVTSDIGSVGRTGSAAFANGVFTIKGAGADIWGNSDSFRFVYQTLTGDGQIVARVLSLQNTHGYAKAGVMFRESLSADSVRAMMDLTPSYYDEFSYRSSTGGSTAVAAYGGFVAPYWVKLVRSGNTFIGYISRDAGVWMEVGRSTITMASTVYVGLVVCSHNTQVLTTATIDRVEVKTGTVGSPTVAITAPTSGAVFSTQDPIAITAIATPGTGATVKQVEFYSDGYRIGTATASPYTVAWSSPYTGTLSLTAVVTDTLGNKATSNPVIITVSYLPIPWLSEDIGSVGVVGSASYANGVFTLKGSGANIWGTTDAFRFVYKPLTGDGQITARVLSLQNTNSYAKSGVMMRESLAAGSRHVMVDLTPTYGAEFSRRTTTGGSTDVTSRSGPAAPYWVRLVRSGNTFSGYVSTNGTTWTLMGSSTIAMNSTVYVGLIDNSHNNSVLCTTTIDSVE